MVTPDSLKILITGCNTGIGLGLAKELLRKGHFLIACCRSNQYFSFLHAEFGDFPNQFSLYAFDLDGNFEDSLEKIQVECGTPDVIINNAGVYPRSATLELDDVWHSIDFGMRINVKAPMRICEYFKSSMSSLAWARIINVSSKMASLADNRSGGSLAYRNSKLGLNLYTLNLAHELNNTQIKVFCVHPGWIQTRMGGINAPDNIDQAVQRILYCLSDDAARLHGQFLIGDQVIPW